MLDVMKALLVAVIFFSAIVAIFMAIVSLVPFVLFFMVAGLAYVYFKDENLNKNQRY